MGCKAGLCNKTFTLLGNSIVRPPLKEWLNKAKEALSPRKVRLSLYCTPAQYFLVSVIYFPVLVLIKVTYTNNMSAIVLSRNNSSLVKHLTNPIKQYLKISAYH